MDELKETFIVITNIRSNLSKCINIEDMDKETTMKIFRFYESLRYYSIDFDHKCVD
jgi:hypothetical protein